MFKIPEFFLRIGLFHPLLLLSPAYFFILPPCIQVHPLFILGLGLCFLLDMSKKVISFIICDQLKKPAAGGNLFSLQKIVTQSSAEIRHS